MQNLPKRAKDSRDERPSRDDRSSRSDRPQKDRKPKRAFAGGADIEMEMYRIEVGHAHGVKPGNIVGAIANETGIDGDHIARIRIQDDYSTVELPAGIPKELFEELKKVRVAGQQLNISKMGEGAKKAAKSDDGAKKVDKSKKRMGSTSRRAKPKAE
jgi:ATP-dependent RNA helicase DeaD